MNLILKFKIFQIRLQSWNYEQPSVSDRSVGESTKEELKGHVNKLRFVGRSCMVFVFAYFFSQMIKKKRTEKVDYYAVKLCYRWKCDRLRTKLAFTLIHRNGGTMGWNPTERDLNM